MVFADDQVYKYIADCVRNTCKTIGFRRPRSFKAPTYHHAKHYGRHVTGRTLCHFAIADEKESDKRKSVRFGHDAPIRCVWRCPDVALGVVPSIRTLQVLLPSRVAGTNT